MIEGDIAVRPSSSSTSRDSVFNSRRFFIFHFTWEIFLTNSDVSRTWDYGKVPYTFDPSISREGEFDNQK